MSQILIPCILQCFCAIYLGFIEVNVKSSNYNQFCNNNKANYTCLRYLAINSLLTLKVLLQQLNKYLNHQRIPITIHIKENLFILEEQLSKECCFISVKYRLVAAIDILVKVLQLSNSSLKPFTNKDLKQRLNL